MPEEFYITWNKQIGSDRIDVSGSQDDEIILSDGRHLYDFVSTSFQASFGHSNEVIRQRIHRQLDALPIASPKSIFDLKRAVTDKLLRLLDRNGGQNNGRIFYTVSGAEAVENALKIARHLTKRPVVLARSRSYHGATLGAMSVSGDWRSQDHLLFAQGTVRIPEPQDDPDGTQTRQIVQQAGPENVAAVIVETISGVNGVIVPPDSWWSAIGTMCDEFGILLIADEVLVGFGRTGPTFGFHHFDIKPDLICLSKSISGGYVPFGAVWTTDRIAENYDNQVLACGLTNYAHPLGLAALDGVIELLQDRQFQHNKRKLEQLFATRLDEFRLHPSISEIRYRGLLAAINFKIAAPSWHSFLDNGLYLIVIPHEKMLIIAPPLISSPQRLGQAFDRMRETIDLSGAATTTVQSGIQQN